MSVVEGSRTEAVRPFAPLPVPSSIEGPRTRRLVKRLALILTAVFVVGLAVEVAAASPALIALGLGLLLPGGGFLYAGAYWMFAASLVVFVLSLLVFAVMSPYWVPPLVWVALAGAAALVVGGETVEPARWIIPAVVLALVAVTLVARRAQFRGFLAEVTRRNEHLSGRTWTAPAAEVVRPAASTLGDDDLGALRRGLDLLLQPVDGFEGFLTRDQYREAAWRYQINFASWNLSMYQYVHAPAFSGYLTEAQRLGIEKTLDPRVWRYWRYEHLLGSLRWDPDPIKTDNIMLSGYFAAQIGAYETASGDHRFSEPGALTFDDGRHRYPYDYGSICRALRDNFASGPLCMFPCEPNWVYPQCNEVGMVGLLFHDQLHGDGLAESVWDSFVDSAAQDLARPDDRVVTLRSNRWGVAIPGMEVGVMSDAGSAFWMSPMLPEVAARRWELARHDNLRIDGDGALTLLQGGRIDRVDPGNYNLNSGAFTFASMMLAAREMGDEEIYTAALVGLERECEPEVRNGARHLRKASPMAQGAATIARVMRKHAWHDMVRVGQDPRVYSGPRLDQAPYPDVLVARAVSDGRGLELELVPGAGGGRVDLVLGGLATGGDYIVSGAVDGSARASEQGFAALRVDLDRRQRVEVRPRT
jgi:hypothetical protein